MASPNDSADETFGFDPASVRGALRPSLDAVLARWVEAAAVDEAAAARARRHWLTVQAEAEATVTGVLVDLGERGRPVAVHVDDRTVRGRIVGIGADFVVLGRDDGRAVIVALDAVATIRSTEEQTVWGDRDVRVDTELAGILGPIAADRPQITVWTTAGAVSGVLRSAGSDVVRLRIDDGTAIWIPVRAVRVLSVE